MTQKTLSELLDEPTQAEKLKEYKRKAKQDLQYYIDKNHPEIPTHCQVCKSTEQVGKVIPDHKHPLEFNLLCQDCINNIFNHTGLPIAELPDTINAKELPKQATLPNRATVRKKLSSWRKRHQHELESLRCQGCGVLYTKKKLHLVPPDLRKPFTVNVACPSCDYNFRNTNTYPKPIDLLTFTESELEREAEEARTESLAHKTHVAINHQLKIFDLKPTRCSFCDMPLTPDHKIILNSPGDTINFYTACSNCINSPNFPQDYKELENAQQDPSFLILKGIYSISELITWKSFDTS